VGWVALCTACVAVGDFARDAAHASGYSKEQDRRAHASLKASSQVVITGSYR